jgi:two-component system, NarL family, sensor histidine kinase UhpB
MQMSLFWRVFLANAAVVTAGGLALALTPVSVSERITLAQAIDLAIGVTALLIVNLMLLRPLLRPIARLVRTMRGVDLLRTGARVPVESPAEIGELELAFNEMLDRLEDERRQAGARALRAQEAERRRIARGLHDEVGQTMTGVLFQLKRLAEGARPEQRDQLAEAQRYVRASLEEVRRIAQELLPEMLEHLGLASSLKALATGFTERTGIAVKVDVAGDLPPLDSEAELVVYRIAQESLTNVARHADASSVVLSLAPGQANGRARSVVLRVADDGRGFRESTVESGGLRGIRERALIVDAALAIKPGRDGGVEVRLEVPAGRGD